MVIDKRDKVIGELSGKVRRLESGFREVKEENRKIKGYVYILAMVVGVLFIGYVFLLKLVGI